VVDGTSARKKANKFSGFGQQKNTSTLQQSIKLQYEKELYQQKQKHTSALRTIKKGAFFPLEWLMA